jgi:ankyrin repeat protein
LQVVSGKLEMVQLMLSKGVDVNQASCKWTMGQPGDNPLMSAVSEGYKDIVRELLAAGANVNHQEIDPHRSPLIAAILEEEVEIAEMLIDAGADVNYDAWCAAAILQSCDAANSVGATRLCSARQQRVCKARHFKRPPCTLACAV